MADSIEKDILTLVRTFSGVTGWVGTGTSARVYFTALPEGTTVAYPYIVYSTISSNGEYIYLATATSDALVEFSVFDTHLHDGLACANELFDALSAYHGKPGAKTIHYVSCDGPRVLKDPDYDNIYRIVVSAEVRYGR